MFRCFGANTGDEAGLFAQFLGDAASLDFERSRHLRVVTEHRHFEALLTEHDRVLREPEACGRPQISLVLVRVGRLVVREADFDGRLVYRHVPFGERERHGDRIVVDCGWDDHAVLHPEPPDGSVALRGDLDLSGFVHDPQVTRHQKHRLAEIRRAARCVLEDVQVALVHELAGAEAQQCGALASLHCASDKNGTGLADNDGSTPLGAGGSVPVGSGGFETNPGGYGNTTTGDVGSGGAATGAGGTTGTDGGFAAGGGSNPGRGSSVNCKFDTVGNQNRNPGFCDLAPAMLSAFDPDTADPVPVSTASLGAALPTNAPAGWNWHTIDGAMCRDGSPTGFYTHDGTASSLLIYLEGGGACSDDHFCAFNPSSVNTLLSGDGESVLGSTFGAGAGWQQPGVYTDNTGVQGIFDTTNTANPYKDWNIVYVPYCTGDVFFGKKPNATVSAGATGQTAPQQFVGGSGRDSTTARCRRTARPSRSSSRSFSTRARARLRARRHSNRSGPEGRGAPASSVAAEFAVREAGRRQNPPTLWRRYFWRPRVSPLTRTSR